ncbi:Stabilin-2 [Trichinella spiralis]|uniref:Stabilin-2 n=1 Tax=Trichinella spiralis TaxID=6334 RepID=A0ABR3KNE6_TRISP
MANTSPIILKLVFCFSISAILFRNSNSEQSNPLVNSETDSRHIPSATDYDFVDDTTPPKQQNQLFTQDSHPPNRSF